jgi:branched-chain amino acid aminotransferase
VIHRNIFHNDSLKPVEKVRLSPGQAGLLCGWGIFTTMRIARGEAFAYERHWKRLEKDAGITHIPMPYTAAKVRVHLHEVIRANKVENGCARIYFVYNSVGFWQSEEERPQTDLIICSAAMPQYNEPIRLGLLEHGRHAGSPLAGGGRGAAGWVRRSGAAERARGSRRVYCGKYFRGEKREGLYAAFEFRMFGRRDAGDFV